MSEYAQECKEKEKLLALKEQAYKIISAKECLNGTMLTFKHEQTNEVIDLTLETPGARKYFLTLL
ncbi:MAG: hypothetical protein ACI35O_01865 [Bacillaceae bacterium]